LQNYGVEVEKKYPLMGIFKKFRDNPDHDSNNRNNE